MTRPRSRRAKLVTGMGTLLSLGVSSGLCGSAAAQEVPIGTWKGTLAVVSLEIVFHIEEGEGGVLGGTMDAQGATGIPLADVALEGGSLSFDVPGIPGAASYEGVWSEETEGFEGQWHQSGQTFPLDLRRPEDHSGPNRPQDPVPPFPYESIEVRFSNHEAGIELAGTLTLPAGEGPFPGVVTISGSGPQDRDEALLGHRPFAVLADHLTRQGVAVLRFDDRGVGESGGEFAEATSADFAGDVRAALAVLRDRTELDARRVGLIGHSEGGLIAPMVAAGSEDVAFIVLMAGPGVPGDEILYEQSLGVVQASGGSAEAAERNVELQRRLFRIVREETDREVAATRLMDALEESVAGMTPEDRAIAGITDETKEQILSAQVQQVNSPWFRFFIDADPAESLRRVTVPVLALNGEHDLQVPPYQNLPAIEAALSEAGNPDYTIRKLPKLNHLFQTSATGSPQEYAQIEETIAPLALDLVASWILERFGG